MYKLMIVDDEMWIRKRLIQTIDWEALCISEVYEAKSGDEAFGIAIEAELDIIITDICMDHMDGLELMQALHASSLFPQLIVISGYSDFEYAQQSIRNGVSAYLLKPVDPKDLIPAIKNCVNNIVAENNYKQTVELFTYYQEHHKNILLEQYLLELLDGYFQSEDAALERLAYIDTKLLDCALTCIAFNASNASGLDPKLFSLTVEHVLARLSKTGKVILQRDGDFACFCFSDAPAGPDELRALCDTVGDQIRSITGYSLHYGIGDTVHNVFDAPTSYNAACKALHKCESEQPTQPTNALSGELQHCATLLADCIRRGDQLACAQHIDNLLARSAEVPHIYSISIIYTMVINALIEDLYMEKSSSNHSNTLLLEAVAKGSSVQDAAAMREALESLVDNYCEFNTVKRHYIVEQATEYIRENYATIKNQKQVSDHFYINNSYFCRIFKEHTGTTFTLFLARTRIERAKDLILTSNLKLYEIAEQVGYTNFHYFSTVFKGMEGISPNLYRQKLGG